ncbi:unnamed protein product [Cuscuta epithymum]|uniref:Secreted protein n=1 Tax=Cuscuta epithymum TaxID=186058 RepID=A0AAV0CVK6_9ASTE|nr:unnamed protein product [Cuscuta epithymum]
MTYASLSIVLTTLSIWVTSSFFFFGDDVAFLLETGVPFLLETAVPLLHETTVPFLVETTMPFLLRYETTALRLLVESSYSSSKPICTGASCTIVQRLNLFFLTE